MRNLTTALLFIAMSSTQLCATAATMPDADARALAYIAKFALLAQEESKKSGIPASIYLAQACHESGFGTSELAVFAFNHFGHKALGWTGSTYPKIDDDRNAKNELEESDFRKYGSAEESYRAHTVFLKKPRYERLYKYSNRNYESWAKGLKATGYATDPNYPVILINLIEEYKLFEYDGENPIKVGSASIEDDAFDAPTYSLVNYENPQYTYAGDDVIYLSNLDSEDMIAELLAGKRPDSFKNRGKEPIAPQTVLPYPRQTPVPNSPTAISAGMLFAPQEEPDAVQTIDTTLEIVAH